MRCLIHDTGIVVGFRCQHLAIYLNENRAKCTMRRLDQKSDAVERCFMSMIGNFLAISKEQLVSLIAIPESIDSFVFPQDDYGIHEDVLDIGKAWHGIHFLLTGSTWHGDPPLSWVVMGGVPIGPDIFGYGPVRYLLPEQVE